VNTIQKLKGTLALHGHHVHLKSSEQKVHFEVELISFSVEIWELATLQIGVKYTMHWCTLDIVRPQLVNKFEMIDPAKKPICRAMELMQALWVVNYQQGYKLTRKESVRIQWYYTSTGTAVPRYSLRIKCH
jgi:hypothetical protein